MERKEAIIIAEITQKNRKGMCLFLAILLAMDSSYAVATIFWKGLLGADRQFEYLALTGVILVASLALFIALKALREPPAWFIAACACFCLFSRTLFLDLMAYSGLALVPYICFLMIFPAILVLRRELVVAIAFGQASLLAVLLSNRAEAGLVYNTMLTTSVVGAVAAVMSRSEYRGFVERRRAELRLNEERTNIEILINSMDTAAMLIAGNGNILYANSAMRRLAGMDADLKVDWMRLRPHCRHEGDFERLVKGHSRVVKDGQPQELGIVRFSDAGNVTRQLRVSLRPVVMQDTAYDYLTAVDLTKEIQFGGSKDLAIELSAMLAEGKPLEAFLKHVLERLITMIPEADAGTILLDDGAGTLRIAANVGYVAEKAAAFALPLADSIFSRSAVSGNTDPIIINGLGRIRDSLVPEIPPTEKGVLIESQISCPIVIDEEVSGLLNIDSSGDKVFSPLDVEVIRFIKNQLTLLLKANRLMKQNEFLSRYDQMTGLHNRWFLDEYRKSDFQRCLRYGQPFCLAMIDVDFLKRVNDELGHDLGDEYLKSAARLLSGHSRSSDQVVRMGGDEFLGIYLATEPGRLAEKLERTRALLAEEMARRGVTDIPCSFSYGISSFPADGDDFDELLRLADKRLYVMKKASRPGC
ncbi:MAG: diguanylate cyclase [Spirochaetaceae bacterium]|nr:diguanylate cyclase [Spirochaetaceae bacterium]